MSKLVVTVGVIVVAAGAAGIWLQHLVNVQLRREVSLLRDEMQGMSGRDRQSATVVPPSPTLYAAANGERSAGLSDDISKLREEIGALRNSTQELNKFAQMAQAAAALKSMGGTENSVATKLIPVNAMKNAGKSTPEATTETVLWAAAGGDVDTLSNALTFTPTAREKADAWFASLSEGTRQQYGSPEKVIALMIAKDAANLSGMQVLGQKDIATDHVGVRVRFAAGEGKVKDDNLVMRRADDGWRMLLSDVVVDKFARQLGGGK